ncbi:MAG TPA: hypothetical protein VNO54_24435 [Streptosporangiaceae bacterium]|nr:hypothetical protein [Streptosporangiaceae bacterium]
MAEEGGPQLLRTAEPLDLPPEERVLLSLLRENFTQARWSGAAKIDAFIAMAERMVPVRYQRPSTRWNRISMRRGMPVRAPSVVMSIVRSAAEESGPMARAGINSEPNLVVNTKIRAHSKKTLS